MNKKLQFKNLLIISSFSVYLMTIFLIQNSTLNLVHSLANFAQIIKSGYIILSLLFILLFNKYSVKQIVVLATIFIPLFVTRVIVGVSPLLDLMIVITGLKCLSLKKILNTFFVTQAISFILILSLFFLSVIPDRVVIRDGIVRSSLGFWHPNTVGVMLLSLFMLSTFSEKKMTKLIFKIGVFNIISIIFYGLTNSRTSFFLILVVSCLTLLQYFFKNRNFLFINSRWFIPIIFIILFVVSYVSSILYLHGNSLIIKLSILLSNRISIGSRFINEYRLTFFGQQVEYSSLNYSVQEVVGFQYKVLDNVYLKYLLNYGAFSIGLLSLYLYRISKTLNNYYLKYWNIYLLIFLIFGLMEQSVFNVSTNFLLLFGVILLNNKDNEEFLG
ncbi:hypothetical protein IGJ02_000686 [Enterococcus sp. DIV0724b]|uniref:hypothetical protein n=1 Tax=Enterococcus sp. DIV0724b TaxID=2774694 RepID=UPI003D2FDE27